LKKTDDLDRGAAPGVDFLKGPGHEGVTARHPEKPLAFGRLEQVQPESDCSGLLG